MAKNTVPIIFRDIYALEDNELNSNDKLILFGLAVIHDKALDCSPLVFKKFADDLHMARNTLKSRLQVLEEKGLLKVIEGETVEKRKHTRYVQLNIGRKSASEQRLANQKMMFQHFWLQYPRKMARATALAAWLKLDPTEDLAIRIQQDVGERQFYLWSRNDPKFIPYASTYLNQRRWEDELDKTVDDSPASGGSVIW